MPLDTVLCRTDNCRTIPTDGYANRGLCAVCEAAGREALKALPQAHRDLLPLVGEKPATGIGATGGKFGPSVPINLAVDALVREIRYAVEQWEVILRDRARLGKPLKTVPDGCKLLAAWWAAFLATPPWAVATYPDWRITTMDGPDAIVWLTSLHRRAVATIGQTVMVMEIPGICPACRHPSLRHRDSDDIMWCDNCRTHWPWDEYAIHVDLLTGTIAV